MYKPSKPCIATPATLSLEVIPYDADVLARDSVPNSTTRNSLKKLSCRRDWARPSDTAQGKGWWGPAPQKKKKNLRFSLDTMPLQSYYYYYYYYAISSVMKKHHVDNKNITIISLTLLLFPFYHICCRIIYTVLIMNLSWFRFNRATAYASPPLPIH